MTALRWFVLQMSQLACKYPDELPSSVPRTKRMKVLFVGDNRNNVNWGRGASIALGQLLSGSFEITGRVTGDFFDLSTAEAGYVGTLMPAKYYRLFRYLLIGAQEGRLLGTSGWNTCLALVISSLKILLSALRIS